MEEQSHNYKEIKILIKISEKSRKKKWENRLIIVCIHANYYTKTYCLVRIWHLWRSEAIVKTLLRDVKWRATGLHCTSVRKWVKEVGLLLLSASPPCHEINLSRLLYGCWVSKDEHQSVSWVSHGYTVPYFGKWNSALTSPPHPPLSKCFFRWS